MRKADVRSMAVCAGVATAMLALAGCSSVPDEVNPAEWYRSASSWLSDDTAARKPADAGPVAEPTPAEGVKSYPNLASVPERPKPTVDPASRRDTIAALQDSASRADSAAEALKERAGEEVARRELPMAAPPAAGAAPRLPEPRSDGVDSQRAVTGLAMPPAPTPADSGRTASPTPTSDLAAPASTSPVSASPQTPAAMPTASGPAPAQATASMPAAAMPDASSVQAPVAAAPAAAAPSTPPRAAQATFTPGARLAPRPPVMPPQPLSLRAAG